MRARTILLRSLLTCGAIVALVWIFVQRRGDERESTAPVVPFAPEVAVERPPEPLLERAAVVASLAGVPEPVTSPFEPAAPAMFVLEGTLVVVDAEGNENSEGNGEFVLLHLNGEEAYRGLPIVITKGRWRAEIPPESIKIVRLEIRELVVGGTPARVVEKRIPIPKDGWLELRATSLDFSPAGEKSRRKSFRSVILPRKLALAMACRGASACRSRC